jgi:hypothetical protein
LLIRKEKTMADYVKALKEGFEAARKADLARKEIDEVFKELNAQVLQATENKVSIERRWVRDESPSTVIATTLLKAIREPPTRHWTIVAFNPSVDREKIFELALWAMDRAGYPCTLTWSNQKHICEDKEALSNALSDLLKDPVVGERLYTLTKLEPTKKE